METASDRPSTQPPAARMVTMLSAHILAQSLYVAAPLGLADHLADRVSRRLVSRPARYSGHATCDTSWGTPPAIQSNQGNHGQEQ